jgi:hypothetical protein
VRQRTRAAALAALALAVAACSADRPGHGAITGSRPLPSVARVHPDVRVVVTVSRHARSIRVPRSYLGVSAEYWGIDDFGRLMGDYERVLSLLRVPGNGPFVLRIGGDSADRSVLDMRTRLPAAIFDVRAPWFRRLRTLVAALHARLIFDLGLVTETPLMVGRWAHAAMAELPRASLMDYEIGNEPDLYNRSYWATVFSPIGVLLRNLPLSVTPSSYVQLSGAYSAVLSKISPGIGLGGPVVAYPAIALNWISTLLKGAHRGLKLVTAHEYPYSGCVPPLSPLYATIGRVLSEDASAEMAQDVRPAVVLAHRAGLPFRLTEFNSVTCGGKRGVSNTFATALWAPDALFELMRVGVDGVNVHVRAYAVNGAFGIGGTGIVPHPLYYGLVLFARMLGPDARLVGLRLAAPPSLDVKAWAVQVGARDLRVLVIDKGRHPVRAVLRLPASAPAAVDRLLASSAQATTGETLDGQHLGVHDTWVGPPSRETIRPSAGRYELTVPATSAALITVQTEARAR